MDEPFRIGATAALPGGRRSSTGAVCTGLDWFTIKQFEEALIGSGKASGQFDP